MHSLLQMMLLHCAKSQCLYLLAKASLALICCFERMVFSLNPKLKFGLLKRVHDGVSGQAKVIGL